jgi:hypothetical protein
MNLRRWMMLTLALLGGLLLASVALAAPTVTTIERWVLAGGGGHAASAPYTLDGAIGQPVVGRVHQAGYELFAGFWGGGAGSRPTHEIYLPLILRRHS